MKTELTRARLRELLSYDPETGVFEWIVSRSGVKRPEAGGPDGQGYVRIKIDGRYYGAHRLAWMYVTGGLPGGQIDHLDGCRTNNRFSNLRDVSAALNRQNLRKASTRSKTGLLGVCAPTHCCRDYKAMITVDGHRIVLGRFEFPEEAHAAYVIAKRKLHEGCTL
jgi:hypothetical protein